MQGIWMTMRPPHQAQEGLEIVAPSQLYAQNEQFVYLGGTITAEVDMTAEIRRYTGAEWSDFRRYAKCRIRPNHRDRADGAKSLNAPSGGSGDPAVRVQ